MPLTDVAENVAMFVNPCCGGVAVPLTNVVEDASKGLYKDYLQKKGSL